MKEHLAGYIDHTVLKSTTTLADVRKLCDEAMQYGFAAVCVPPPFTRNAAAFLEQSDVEISTVIGFPFGYSTTKAKMAEVEQALKDQASELDMVINLVALKSQAWKYLENEVRQICGAAHQAGAIVKVIIETGVLSEEEIIQCCQLYRDADVDFLKTSTGYAEKGATIEAVQLMRQHLPSSIRVKASGGIRTYIFAKQLIEAGAERLGCSASVAIIEEFEKQQSADDL